MRGNSHVQFLGEEMAVTSSPYPTTCLARVGRCETFIEYSSTASTRTPAGLSDRWCSHCILLFQCVLKWDV